MQVGTFGLSIRGETPEETLSRIVYGRFGVHLNATNGGINGGSLNATNSNSGGASLVWNAATSGGGNHSPPQDDVFPLY